ncbi:MAG: cytochrome P450 [Casimicrobiaceae bacterium]
MIATAPVRDGAPVADIDASLGDATLAQLAQLFARHGDAFRVRAPLLGKNLLVLSHPDHVRHVLVEHQAIFAKGIGIERVAILLGKGLMTSDGDLWRTQRKAIQPAFHRSAVRAHIDDIVAANQRLARRLTLASASPVDLTRELSAIALEVILRVIFGPTYDRLIANDNPFALLSEESERDLQFAYAFRQLGGLLQQEIDRRRAGDGGAGILQTLIDARDRHSGEPMSDRQVRDEVFTLIVAGHETTASALAWTWYLIATHPHVAARLTEEIDGASDDDRRQPAVHRFAYTQQVIAEALRMYPPGWLLTRRARNAVSFAGIDIAAGDDVLVSPYLVHRHPEFWPRADSFEPDRFTPAATASRSRFCYLPFGLGPRACIGENLALTEMLAHVVTLAYACRIELIAGQTIEMEAKVNLRPHPAIQVRTLSRRPA